MYSLAYDPAAAVALARARMESQIQAASAAGLVRSAREGASEPSAEAAPTSPRRLWRRLVPSARLLTGTRLRARAS